jgi:serine/threonine protein kinase
MSKKIVLKDTLIAKKYRVIEVLRTGSFSNLYKVQDIDVNIAYVLKHILYSKATEVLENEIAILEDISMCECACKYYDKVCDNDEVYLRFQYLGGKTLNQILKKNFIFDESLVIKLLQDISEQLYFAFKKNIIHNDIKLKNIIYANSRFYLINWKNSLYGEKYHYEKISTNDMFLAPEYYNAKVLFKSDIYTFGHIIYYLLHSHPLFKMCSGISNAQIMLSHLTKKIEYKKHISNNIKNILEHMLCKDDKKRIDICDLYNLLFKSQPLKEIQCKVMKLPSYELDSDLKILIYLSKKNITVATFLLALYLENNHQYKEAIALYYSLTKKEYTKAMYNLGSLYEVNNVVKQNYKFSAYWYFKAGKLGNVKAIHSMANFFKYAKGVQKDTKKADELFALAARKGCKRELF